MSSSLSWLPPPKELEPNYIGLKYEIGHWFEGEDYNGGCGTWEASSEIIPYLKGIAAVGSTHQSNDANSLIGAIEKYGKVILTIA